MRVCAAVYALHRVDRLCPDTLCPWLNELIDGVSEGAQVDTLRIIAESGLPDVLARHVPTMILSLTRMCRLLGSGSMAGPVNAATQVG